MASPPPPRQPQTPSAGRGRPHKAPPCQRLRSPKVMIIRVWLLKEDHLGAEEVVVGAIPLEHHKSLFGLAHLVGSRGFLSKYRDYLVTFKYSQSPPSSWQIKQVMSSALVKCRNTQIPQVVRSSRSHLATAPMAKWSAQMQLFTPTLVSRSELRSYSSNL